jgi:23S rRNA pseudouridine1911/1915/1917 synthase
MARARKYIGAPNSADARADAGAAARPGARKSDPPVDVDADEHGSLGEVLDIEVDELPVDGLDDGLDDAPDDAPDTAAPGAERFDLVAGPAQDGVRLDRALALLLPQYSRSRLQQWIEEGAVALNGRAPRARDTVFAGDRLAVQAAPLPEQTAFTPESMALDIVHEDDAIIVLDKPPGLVVHPAAGHWGGTLLNGLLAHDAALARVPRAGIVHRLDADTSGLMVVARTVQAQTHLVRQLAARSVTREYWAIVAGAAPAATTIESAIARDPRNPLRFRTSNAPTAKDAVTHVRLVELAEDGGRTFSWVACRLETGRTHQIRVHLESIGHPLVGDRLYRRGLPSLPASDPAPWARFGRQALHACRLALVHPATGATCSWFRPPPADMRALMDSLGMRGGRKPIEVFD